MRAFTSVAAVAALSILSLLAAGACRRSGHADAPARAATAPFDAAQLEAAQRGLAKRLASDRYDAPAGGALTAAQLEMYVAVKARVLEIRRQRPPEPSAPSPDPVTAVLERVARAASEDLVAASTLGANTAEFNWVKVRVLEAEVANRRTVLLQFAREGFDRQLAELQRVAANASDAREREAVAIQLREIEELRRAAAPPSSPADAHNRALVAQFAPRLEQLGFEALAPPEPQRSGLASSLEPRG